MEQPKSITEIILTSTVLASIVTFVLTVIFGQRQKYKYDKKIKEIERDHHLEIERSKNDFEKKLEKTKQEFQLRLEAQKEEHERKMEVLKRIESVRYDSFEIVAETCYRAKNLSRAISKGRSEDNAIERLSQLKGNIENLLFKGGVHLKKGEIFKEVHAYKNLLEIYIIQIHKNLNKDMHDSDEKDVEKIYNRIENLFNKIDELILEKIY
ncbi:hypothetical protein [Aquimarina sediminis]|uniref:hypothetical protein n=1 Tax=Aquimarina sediminis TaxID=2070536 RepID=UPI000FFF3783|nr:hypothetical protein [Aquimarina sediminis]